MKKAVLALSLILCLSFVLFLKDYRLVKASPRMLTVDDDGQADFRTIQEAVNHASPGDIIFVYNGIYRENVFINKSISLIGKERDSTIIDGSEIGSVIYIKEADNVSVKSFTLRKSGTTLYNSSGVLIERSNSSIISDNVILTNKNGISLFNSNNAVIYGNNITKNSYDGINIYSSFNNLIDGNVISSNFGGISLYWSFNNLVKNNIILGNTGGVNIYSSSNNVLSINSILNNSWGISLFYSSNNFIYHNNFGNIIQVSSSESTNLWSYDGEGNYWNDYSGQDLNEDGIGDIPYVIDAYQIDDNPLMGMFSKFDITYERKTYQVTVITNSSISDFHFQIGAETGNRIIQFKAAGKENTVGFCRITIPNQVMNNPYVVLLESDEDVTSSILDSDRTRAYLYLIYLHKNQTIKIISSELYNELFKVFRDLNVTYYELFNMLTLLWSNYTQLQENYQELNASYQKHLLEYSENIKNTQNLKYTFAAVSAILIVATAYLSKRAHTSATSKIKRFRESG